MIIPAGNRMVVAGKVPAEVLSKGSWMVESQSKPPRGKCVRIGRSLVEGYSGNVTLEMFNPSEEDIVLYKNTHIALELQRVCKNTQYDLSKDEKKQLSKFLHRHKDVFQLEGEPLERTHLVQHDILMTGPPIRQPPRRFPKGLRQEGERQIQEMLQRDVIELVQSC